MWASVLTLQWCLDRQCQVNVWLEGANIAPLWVAVTMASIWSTNGSIPAHLPDPGSRDNKPCRQTAHMLWLMRADTLSKHATENSPSVFTHSHTLKIERWTAKMRLVPSISAPLREITPVRRDECVCVVCVCVCRLSDVPLTPLDLLTTFQIHRVGTSVWWVQINMKPFSHPHYTL